DARHVTSLDLRDEAVIRSILVENRVDPDPVFEHIRDGGVLDTVHKEHDAAVAENDVWGVPTFIAGDRAVFVRLMHGPEGDAALARRTVDHVLDLVEGWSDLNEFKATSVSK